MSLRFGNARDDEADTLLDLLCAAHEEIDLAPQVCDETHRDKYLAWMKRKCAEHSVLVVLADGKTVGFLMFNGIQTIEYVVIQNDYRCRGIGVALVRRFLSSVDHTYLMAQARNPASLRMLKKCGFIHEGDYDHTGRYPELVLRRGSDDRP